MQRTTLWPPNPNEFEIADRRAPVALERARLARHVVEVEALVGLLEVERRRRDRTLQGPDGCHRLDSAGGSEQVADRRLESMRSGPIGARSPSTRLIASVSERSLSGVEVPWAFT